MRESHLSFKFQRRNNLFAQEAGQWRGFTAWKTTAPAVRGSPALVFWGRRGSSIDKMDRRCRWSCLWPRPPAPATLQPAAVEDGGKKDTGDVALFWVPGARRKYQPKENGLKGLLKRKMSHPILGLGDSLFPLLALWGNKNCPPSMKVKNLENSQNRRGLKGCKRSSLNAQGTETDLSHSLLGLKEFPFPITGPVG